LLAVAAVQPKQKGIKAQLAAAVQVEWLLVLLKQYQQGITLLLWVQEEPLEHQSTHQLVMVGIVHLLLMLQLAAVEVETMPRLEAMVGQALAGVKAPL
jgi:hypothetical protein